jgi:hypothetical protein
MPEIQALSPRAPRLPAATYAFASPVLDIDAQEFDSFAYLRTYWNIINT